MESLGCLGVLLAFAVIALIDTPKLNGTSNKKKYKTVYYSVIAAGILIGILRVLKVLPDFDKDLAFFYQNMTGIK
jgi:hypothetical protein